MNIKYAKQIDGISYYAQVIIDKENLKDSSSIIRDECTWKHMKSSYEKLVINESFIKQKELVLKGMYYGLEGIETKQPKMIKLLDIIISNTDTSSSVLFVVGFLSVLRAFGIELTELDIRKIDRFVSNHSDTYFDINQEQLDLGIY